MNERLISMALQEKARQRDKNRQEEAARRQRAESACPGLAQLLQQRSRALADALRGALEGKSDGNLGDTIRGYNLKIHQLLQEGGLPQDYLEPVFTCSLCEDTGYTPGAPRALCACVTARVTELMETEHAFEKGQSFEAFDLNYIPDTPLPGEKVTQREVMKVIRDRCESYANGIPEQSVKTLLMVGSSGLGKTYLLRCIYRRAEERGIPAVCVTANRFLQAVRDSMFSREGDMLEEITQAPLLLVDDLGSEPLMQNITVEAVFNLINERQNMGLCTVLSTNLSLAELKERYTERVFSRLMDRRSCQTLRFMGTDLRLQARP